MDVIRTSTAFLVVALRSCVCNKQGHNGRGNSGDVEVHVDTGVDTSVRMLEYNGGSQEVEAER